METVDSQETLNAPATNILLMRQNPSTLKDLTREALAGSTGPVVYILETDAVTKLGAETALALTQGIEVPEAERYVSQPLHAYMQSVYWSRSDVSAQLIRRYGKYKGPLVNRDNINPETGEVTVSQVMDPRFVDSVAEKEAQTRFREQRKAYDIYLKMRGQGFNEDWAGQLCFGGDMMGYQYWMLAELGDVIAETTGVSGRVQLLPFHVEPEDRDMFMRSVGDVFQHWVKIYQTILPKKGDVEAALAPFKRSVIAYSRHIDFTSRRYVQLMSAQRYAPGTTVITGIGMPYEYQIHTHLAAQGLEPVVRRGFESEQINYINDLANLLLEYGNNNPGCSEDDIIASQPDQVWAKAMVAKYLNDVIRNSYPAVPRSIVDTVFAEALAAWSLPGEPMEDILATTANKPLYKVMDKPLKGYDWKGRIRELALVNFGVSI